MKRKFFAIIIFIFIFLGQISFTKNIIVSGSSLYKKESIADVSIFFMDEEDNIFITKSNSKGEFSISIPENKYYINIEKDFFRISDKNLKEYKFRENDNLDVELEKSNSFLDGFIVDKKNRPVEKAKIIIKNNNVSSTIFSDSSGRFSAYLKPGIFTLLVSKYGYSTTGIVRKIEKNSTLSNEKIKLKSFDFYLKGTIIDGKKALPNIEVSLHNEFFKKIDSVITDKNGDFYFYKIPLGENLILFVNNKKYKIYKSELFNFGKKTENKLILLEKK